MPTPRYDLALLVGRDASAQAVRETLAAARAHLGTLTDEEFTAVSLDRQLRAWAAREGVDAGHLFRALRVAVQGDLGHPGLFDAMARLGKEDTLRLLGEAQRALDARA